MSLKLSDCDPKLRERIERQMANEEGVERNSSLNPFLETAPTKPAKRIRQDSKPLMNNLETEWLQELYADFPECPISTFRAQAKTYRLANGLRYTPDFTAVINIFPGGLKETAWEVKGKWVDGDSFPKLKMFAAVWPEIRVILAWKDARGKWQEQTIFP